MQRLGAAPGRGCNGPLPRSNASVATPPRPPLLLYSAEDTVSPLWLPGVRIHPQPVRCLDRRSRGRVKGLAITWTPTGGHRCRTRSRFEGDTPLRCSTIYCFRR